MQSEQKKAFVYISVRLSDDDGDGGGGGGDDGDDGGGGGGAILHIDRPPPIYSLKTLGCSWLCHCMHAVTKPTAPSGLPRRSPTPVLTGPYAA